MGKDISISAAANGGFVVMCTKEIDKKNKSMAMITEDNEVPYVCKDMNAVLKLLKEKLPMYAKEEKSETKGILSPK